MANKVRAHQHVLSRLSVNRIDATRRRAVGDLTLGVRPAPSGNRGDGQFFIRGNQQHGAIGESSGRNPGAVPYPGCGLGRVRYLAPEGQPTLSRRTAVPFSPIPAVKLTTSVWPNTAR